MNYKHHSKSVDTCIRELNEWMRPLDMYQRKCYFECTLLNLCEKHKVNPNFILKITGWDKGYKIFR